MPKGMNDRSKSRTARRSSAVKYTPAELSQS